MGKIYDFSDGGGWNGLPRSNDGEARFSAYVEGLTSVIGHADRCQAASRLSLGFDDASRAQSVDSRWRRSQRQNGPQPQHQSLLHLHRRGRWSDEKVLAEGAGTGAAGVGTPMGRIQAWIIDRHGAFPRKGSIRSGWLRQHRGEAWQAGQLSGRGDVVDRQSLMPACRWPIGRTFAEGVGAAIRKRRRKVGVPTRSVSEDQARDRAGTDPLGAPRPVLPRGAGADGRRLRGRH